MRPPGDIKRICTMTLSSSSALIPVHLKTDNMTNPLGLGKGVPELSWSYEDSRTEALQTHWQIRAAASEEALEEGPWLWNSGWMESSSSVGHRYGGPELRSRDRVWWQVRIRDDRRTESSWSRAAWFELGLIDWREWDADWMGFPAGWCGHAADCLVAFQVQMPVTRGRVYVASPSWCEIRLNGTRLGGVDELQPAQCDFSKSVHFLTYDVDSLLVPGENRFMARTGAGWNGTPVLKYRVECDGRPVLRSRYRQPPMALRAPVTRNSVFGGETYDARREMNPDWLRPDGDTPPYARALMRVSGPAGRPRGLEEEPIRPQGEIKPVSWNRIENGHWVADFGRNFAGVCRLHATAPAGSSIVMKFAEVLNPDGSANQDNLMGDEAIDEYIAKGDPGGETWQPHFTYHGFRFVEVGGLPQAPEEDTLAGIPLRTDCRPVGEFSCSNPLLNRIWQMIRDTEASNLHAVPTDCPQRTERMGWLNDMMARCETAMYIFDESNLLAKWLRDIADAQDPETGEVPMTAPLYWGFDIDPVCSSFVEAPLLNYMFYGKRGLLEELFPNMKAWILRMLSCRDSDGILRRGGDVGDWVPPVYDRGMGDARNPNVPHGLVSTALMHYAIVLLTKIARILGREDEAAGLEVQAAAVRRDFLGAYRTEPGRLAPESQSAYVYAVFCGLLPREEVQRAADRLAEIFLANGCKHTTGNIGTKYLLETLSSFGHADLACRLVASEDYPGWGYMLANGATTLWERWEKAEGYGMNSHNHPMLGCPGVWFFKYLGGIRCSEDSAGFERFILQPQFVESLDYVTVSCRSRAGLVRSEWRRTAEGAIECTFEIPANCIADLRLPGLPEKALGAGIHTVSCRPR